MGDGAANDHRMQQCCRANVIDILSLAAKKAKVLDAFDRAADKGIGRANSIRGHGCSGSLRADSGHVEARGPSPRSWPGLTPPPRLLLLCASRFEVAGTSPRRRPCVIDLT